MEIKDWSAALASALIYLDTNEVLHLSRGKAIFRAAMRIELNAEARRRQFGKSDYAELNLHYKDKIVQVHVMAEYAKLALEKAKAALALVHDYFSMDREQFFRRYFAGRKELLEMATTESAHRRILVDLKNPAQQAIVAAPVDRNHLVLAGPGSGKTRVIVHRVAWLLCECMILPEEILVLTYNRAASVEIRRRLWALAGIDAAGVQVLTLHGMALRLTGTSYAVAMERSETIDFGAVIRLAAQRLRASENDESGISARRDRMLSGLRHILVDEYQDINGDHYELISALAGRTLSGEEDKLSLFAVGDDDQNIYAFDGANVRYIRQFEADYRASRHHLLENYRSTAHIVDCANRVIGKARERMKTGQEIRIDHARREAPSGGEHEALDPIAQGRVHILELPDDPHLAVGPALAELERVLMLGNSAPAWGSVAVIARHWEQLESFAALCRIRGIPARLLRDKRQPDLHKTREGDTLISLLRGERRMPGRPRMTLRADALSRWFRRRFSVSVHATITHPHRAALAQFIAQSESVAPGMERVAADLIEALYEFGSGANGTAGHGANAPLSLLTAHRAKGLEFDHVLILDGGGWRERKDDERRLFYVAMTRARKTLTLCRDQGSRHAFAGAFAGDCADMCLSSKPASKNSAYALDHRTWFADFEHIVLSWPGRFAPDSDTHQAIARLEVGDSLHLRPRSNGGWELTDGNQNPVGGMSQKFTPPPGEITAVRVAAILVRHAKGDELDNLPSKRWELILPEIEYIPDAVRAGKTV